MDAVSTLNGLFDRLTLGQHPEWFRRWVGPVQEQWTSPAHEIVVEAGYPYPSYQTNGQDLTFGSLSLANAAELLAQISTQSLAHEFPRPPDPALVNEIAQSLAVLGGDAKFATNREGSTWYPLSKATFDVGLVGFNGSWGFAICFEEED
jgi:hypothetical protein